MSFDLMNLSLDWKAVGNDEVVFSSFVAYICEKFSVSEKFASSFATVWCTNSEFRKSFVSSLMALSILVTFNSDNKENN